MKEKRAPIDTFTGRIYLVGPGGYELKLSPGSVKHDLVESSAGHLMLPCSQFHVPMKSHDEVTAFLVGDYFDVHPTSSAPKRPSGGSPPASNASSDSRGKGSQDAARMAELDRIVNQAHDELDLLLESAQSKRLD